MTNWFDLTNFAMSAGGLTIVLLSFILIRIVPYMERWVRKYFTVFFHILAAYILFDMLSQISLLLLGDRFALLSRVAIGLESFFSSIMMPLLTLYLLRCVREDWRKAPTFYIVGGLWFLYFILLILTQFTTYIYTITADNVYQRGPLYPLLLIPPVLLMLVNLIALHRRRTQLTAHQLLAFRLYLYVPLICILIQMWFYGLLLIVIGTSFAALFLFVFILLDQMEQYIAQRKTIERQAASIRVLQMRPHFIYNTMMSIYYLCKQDADKAQAVILDFNSYLRRNFTAIAKEGTIPFSEELEHTRAYLAVEQVRFEGKLFVEFDTPYMNFRIPPLTLQPIVENAVKHGVDPELAPLYISVYTRETAEGCEIVVEDNGPGFTEDTPQQNQRMADADRYESKDVHIALDNIRDRLHSMCDGTLQIAPRTNGGTIVTISIRTKQKNGSPTQASMI